MLCFFVFSFSAYLLHFIYPSGIVLHFFPVGGYLPYSYVFHYFNDPFRKHFLGHNSKWIFPPLLCMWEGMTLH